MDTQAQQQRDATNAIFELFGEGLSPIQAALGHKNPTTVQGWKERGAIPVKQWPAVIAAAKAEKSIDLRFEDFVMPRKLVA